MSDELYMLEALIEAEKSLEYNDVPVGAIIVKEDKIISRAYNQVEKLGSPLAHAEILAIEEAIKINKYKFLLDSTIYITLEPCSMCAGAIVLARIPRVVIATQDPKSGACGSVFNILQDGRLNHRCKITWDIRKEESSKLLKDFFKQLREIKK